MGLCFRFGRKIRSRALGLRCLRYVNIQSIDHLVVASLNFAVHQAATAGPSSTLVEMFVVRGDGQTTATAVQDSVTPLIAQATASGYSGNVMLSRVTSTPASVNFSLFKVRACQCFFF